MFHKHSLILTLFLSMVTSFGLFAQNRTVTGVVRDSNGAPLMGAGVVVSGTTNGTVTSLEGTFSLRVPSGAVVLEVSSLGYVTKRVNVSATQDNLAVVLEDDALSLNETVVVGYGTQKKVNLTGAVEQVTSDVFEGRASTNATQMLEGAVPNLNITLADGKPGRTADFNVRGTGSINGGSALVLIDGVEGDPSMLNPNDIETVSVLKDAAASAIYGARAPYGVVLITTKEATKGKPQINYTANFSIETPQNKPDVVTDGYVWAEHFYKAYSTYNEGAKPSGINKTQQFSLAWLEEYKRRHDSGNFGTIISDGSMGTTKGRYVYFPKEVDYFDALYKDYVPSMNHNISISGSDGKFDYYLSGRYHHFDGLFNSDKQTDRYNSYNLRAKMGYQALPWLKITNNLDYGFNKYYNPITYSEGSGVVYRNIADEGHPSEPLLNPDGTLTYSGVYSTADLIYGQSGIGTVNEVLKNTTGFAAQWLNNTLRLKGDFTYRKTTYERTKKEARTPYAKSVDADGNSIIEYIKDPAGNKFSETNSWTRYLATNIYTEYENTFGKHYVKGMVGWNYENSNYKQVYTANTDFLTPDIENLNLTLGTDNKTTTSSWSAYQFGGAFFRFNYIFDERYLLEFNGRYDGSSRFPANHRWAFFPSVSAGWRVSQEPWWHVNPSFISNLKLRASYGSLGNANGLGNYQYKQTMSVSTSGRLLNGVKQRYTTSPAALPEDLTWETATTYDGGIDVGFLNSRLTITADSYLRKTVNMIVAGPTVPDVFGASSPKGNYADMSTRGFEISVAWHDDVDIAGKPLTYNIKASLYDYYSIIDKYNNANKDLDNNANQSLAGNYYEGMRIGELWGFVSNGLWQDQASIDAAMVKVRDAGQKYYNPLMQTSKSYTIYPGDIKFEDLNGNGYIDRGKNQVGDPGDRIIIGNEDPRYLYSFNLSLDWNGIWASAFFQGVGKQDWFPSNEASMFWGQYNRPYNNLPKWHLGNYWTEDNPDAYLPRYAGYYAPFYKGTRNASTRYLMNVAYCRLKNVQIGYKLPKNWVEHVGMKGVSVYFSGENLFTWSPLYKITKDINVSNIGNSDPDLTTGSGDAYNYPMLKTYTFGINITF
ncbi:MAG: TonB-dependent receptor [Bacteroidales bacterium]|nr:TonB-dependent receptor [Bacteroidales bacterium]